MQLKTYVPPPQGDSNPVEELIGADGGVVEVDPLNNSLPKRRDGGGEV